VYLWILGLLAASCLGFFLESRLEAQREAKAQMQGLIGPDETALGLSGGRARGGSFDAPSVPSVPSGGGYSGGGGFPSGGGYSGGGYSVPRPYSYPYPSSRPVIIPSPYPTYPSYPVTTIGSDLGFFILLAILGFAVLPMIMGRMRLGGSGRTSRGSSAAGGELRNDIVTITQLQVGLLSEARTLQTELTAMAAGADLDTKTGLNHLLQESVLALLRSPEYWSHARVASQTVKGRQQAAQVFEQLSLAERSKFAKETLSNVDGRVNRQTIVPRKEADSADYIVVTLLVGTADDRPLFDKQIYSTTDLQAALKRLGAVAPDYLMVYELLWSPQDASDSMSYDQMLAAYPNMVQL
jgi:uncharacterized membrane protein